MRTVRRATLIRVMTRAAVIIILLDALLYFGVVVPLGTSVTKQRQEFAVARRRVMEQQTRVVRFEHRLASMTNVDGQIRTFMEKHVPSRRQGYSRVARLIRVLIKQAGLDLIGITYRMEPDPSEPLQKLGIEVSVEGSFPGILNFAHALETSDDLIVLRDFNFLSGDAGALQLRIGADLYLMP